MALESLAGRRDRAPKVLTCSALEKKNVDSVWREIEHRQAKLVASGELLARRKRQNVRRCWSLVEDRLPPGMRTHPAVQTIRGELERAVQTGERPCRRRRQRGQILAAFGLK